jgi:hypothetical protein
MKVQRRPFLLNSNVHKTLFAVFSYSVTTVPSVRAFLPFHGSSDKAILGGISESASFHGTDRADALQGIGRKWLEAKKNHRREVTEVTEETNRRQSLICRSLWVYATREGRANAKFAGINHHVPLNQSGVGPRSFRGHSHNPRLTKWGFDSLSSTRTIVSPASGERMPPDRKFSAKAGNQESVMAQHEPNLWKFRLYCIFAKDWR